MMMIPGIVQCGIPQTTFQTKRQLRKLVFESWETTVQIFESLWIRSFQPKTAKHDLLWPTVLLGVRNWIVFWKQLKVFKIGSPNVCCLNGSSPNLFDCEEYSSEVPTRVSFVSRTDYRFYEIDRDPLFPWRWLISNCSETALKLLWDHCNHENDARYFLNCQGQPKTWTRLSLWRHGLPNNCVSTYGEWYLRFGFTANVHSSVFRIIVTELKLLFYQKE